jgi:hypothetical protein
MHFHVVSNISEQTGESQLSPNTALGKIYKWNQVKCQGLPKRILERKK